MPSECSIRMSLGIVVSPLSALGTFQPVLDKNQHGPVFAKAIFGIVDEQRLENLRTLGGSGFHAPPYQMPSPKPK
jgi:hypothetical protein